jgi:WD40 repeat protein
VRQLAFAPEGQRLAVVEFEPRFGHSLVGIRNTADLKPLRAVELRTGQVVKQVAFSPDGNTLAGINADRTVSLWQGGAWRERAILRQRHDATALAFSPDGEELIVGDAAGSCLVWNVKDGREAFGRALLKEGTVHGIESLAGGDGRVFLTLNRGSQDPLAVQRVTSQGSVVRLWNGAVGGAPVRLGPLAHLVVLGDPDGGLRLWQPFADQRRHRALGGPAPATAAAFSPDGRYLAVGDWTGVVSILRLADRGQVPTVPEVEVAPMPWNAVRP